MRSSPVALVELQSDAGSESRLRDYLSVVRQIAHSKYTPDTVDKEMVCQAIEDTEAWLSETSPLTNSACQEQLDMLCMCCDMTIPSDAGEAHLREYLSVVYQVAHAEDFPNNVDKETLCDATEATESWMSEWPRLTNSACLEQLDLLRTCCNAIVTRYVIKRIVEGAWDNSIHGDNELKKSCMILLHHARITSLLKQQDDSTIPMLRGMAASLGSLLQGRELHSELRDALALGERAERVMWNGPPPTPDIYFQNQDTQTATAKSLLRSSASYPPTIQITGKFSSA